MPDRLDQVRTLCFISWWVIVSIFSLLRSSASDFCLWAPPEVGTIGDTEREEVAWCTKSGRGTRLIPDGTLSGVHFVKTPDYVQITGKGDFTKINVPAGDYGGELDPHGADAKGNPSKRHSYKLIVPPN